jgi:hypothetical protein
MSNAGTESWFKGSLLSRICDANTAASQACFLASFVDK